MADPDESGQAVHSGSFAPFAGAVLQNRANTEEK